MWRSTLVTILFVVAAPYFVSCQQPQTPSNSTPVNPDNKAWLYHSMTKMAMDAHWAIVTGATVRSCGGSSAPSGIRSGSGSDRRDANVVFSPLSISAALSALFLGSWGDTMSQLREGLDYPSPSALDEKDIHPTYKANLDVMLKPGRGVEINYSNTVFGGAGLSVILYFYQDVQNYYKSAIRGVDFEKKPVQAMNEINRWVKEQTKGKISEILGTPLSPETKMAIANAIYFKGAWEVPFPDQYTKLEEFVVNEGDTVQVPMMKEVMEVPYVRDDNLLLQMAAIPYKSAQFAFFVILPSNPGLNALLELESSLTEPILDNLIRQMNTTTLQIVLPRMKLSWKSDLRDVLAKLGVCDVFSPDKADFRRLAVEEGLYLSTLVHQAEMEVNERGTEAAAATVGAVSKTLRVFRANKPFLFFIRDNVTGLPLFWGRVARPKSETA